MKNISAYFVALFLTISEVGFPDEIHLKDGTKIEFTVLKDAGDSCDLETSSGGKLKIKKSDIVKVSLIQPPVVLVGATVSFDKSEKLETINLIPLMDQKNSHGGNWKSDGKKITTPPVPHARILFPITIPEEYDVQMVVQREKREGDAFYIGLPTPSGARAMIAIDSNGGEIRGISGAPETTSKQKTFQDIKPHQLIFQVRKNRLTVSFDGKNIIDWVNPDYASGKLTDIVNIGEKGVVLGDYDTTFIVTKFIVNYPKK